MKNIIKIGKASDTSYFNNTRKTFKKNFMLNIFFYLFMKKIVK